MDDMQQKLDSILGNTEMMSQIMNMAQALRGKQESEPAPVPQPPSGIGGIDPGMIQKIAGIAQQSGIDNNQQHLLRALRPYLSEHRIVKLEKAMRAAKLAGMASVFFGSLGR